MWNALLAGTGVLMLATLYMVFRVVPTDVNLGVVQRIFYLHVPIALVSFLAFAVVFVASILHLVRGKQRWDTLAYAAAEIGVVFATLMLITGILWAKPVWGVWWTWSPQLTTALILWFIYVAYLMLRAYVPQGAQGPRYAAVLGIIGFVDVPIVYMAAKWWRDVHPGAVVGPLAESGSLEPSMQLAFLVALATFTLLFVFLLVERYSLRQSEELLERMRHLYG